MDAYTIALMRRSLSSTEADIAWLDELIESERAARPKRKKPRGPSRPPGPNEI